MQTKKNKITQKNEKIKIFFVKCKKAKPTLEDRHLRTGHLGPSNFLMTRPISKILVTDFRLFSYVLDHNFFQTNPNFANF
jgi:hypothetical protein